MTRSIKFCIISVLTFFVMIFCALGFANFNKNTVYAQTENQVVTYFNIETSSLRISDQGMRWIAKMDAQTYENITTKQNVSFHFVIAPTVLMQAAEGQYMQMQNKILIDVTDFNKAYEEDGFWCINGAVNKLNPKNVAIPYSAVAVIATDIGGVVTYEYTKNLISHSAYDLANNAVVSGLLEDEQVSKILNTYSFLGTEKYPIICESAEQVENLKAINDSKMFVGKTIVADFNEDITLFLQNNKGYDSEILLDCDYLSVNDERVATISDNKILAVGAGETVLVTTTNVADGLTIISNINVLVRDIPSVTISAKNLNLKNRAYTDYYVDKIELKPTVTVDGTKIENANFTFEIKSAPQAISLEYYDEYAVVEGVDAGTATICVKYLDEFGVTTEKDVKVTVNNTLRYGSYEKCPNIEGVYAELPHINAGVRFDNVAITSQENSHIIRLLAVPAGYGVDDVEKADMAQVMYISLIDTNNEENYITIMLKANGKSSYVGARASVWGKHLVGTTVNNFADNYGYYMGENSESYCSPIAECFSLVGEYLKSIATYKNRATLGVSVVGTKVYVSSDTSMIEVIDLSLPGPNGKSWTGFSGNTVDVVVRYACMNIDYGSNLVYVDTLGGQNVSAINNDMYFVSLGNSVYSGECFVKN